MRILLLTHAFNSLTQRIYIELARAGHELSIEFDIHDEVTREAVQLFRPDLLIAPFLKRPLPEEVWRALTCLIVHPGPPGDRGPSALDWAILNGEREWGVTVLQAEAEMDAGPVWASAAFPMREARKGSLYRNEVTEAAVCALHLAVERFSRGDFTPERLDADRLSQGWRPAVRQADRAIDWQRDDTLTVLRKIHSADGQPGVLDEIDGRAVLLFDACGEDELRGEPGALIARREGAICRATVDGAVWIGQLREPPQATPTCKLPAVRLLGEAAGRLPEVPVALDASVNRRTWWDIRYEEADGVGYLHFPFYNGAMGSAACERLRAAYAHARGRPTRVIVLLGGADFWSNGLDLNLIESAGSAADESLRNIEAMDDLARDIIETDTQLTLAALQGNAGAGGVFLALAADRVVARSGVVLNPHYKSMGNLYGSEYWTYLLPRRVGAERARLLTQERLPMGAPQARAAGLIDDCFGADVPAFLQQLRDEARRLAGAAEFDEQLSAKRRRRAEDEAVKPLAAYREEELARMRLNFYGFDPSYHVARYHFVYKVCKSRTPLWLARHRR